MEQNNSLQFLDSLTLAEIAQLEVATGLSFDDLNSAEAITRFIPALTQMALHRLGMEIDLELSKHFTMEETNEIFTAASSSVPVRPDEINRILESVRGKSQGAYLEHSEP